MISKKNRDLLAPYITNLDDQVFSIINLNGLVGAVMARYSRAETGLRETLLREFIVEDKLDLEKADQLIERVLIAYGDDSVGELEGAHLALEGISMLATKVIEHRRIGGSPIEKSTRYVRFDQKDESGEYRYVIPQELSGFMEKRYREVMDHIFNAYAEMWQPVHCFLKTLKPIEDAVYPISERNLDLASCRNTKDERLFKRTYENDLKTKTCDILRAFLPLATKANVGLFGNGRFFQHLISKMLSSPLKEAQVLGQKSLHELLQVIPHYVKRARKLDYLIENERNLKGFAATAFSGRTSDNHDKIRSIEDNYNELFEQAGKVKSPHEFRRLLLDQQENSFLAALVFPYTMLDFEQVRKQVAGFSDEQKKSCYRACYGSRESRRDRPERMIEYGYPHHFELVTEWAVYKDLMRHRMGTALVQPLNPHLGFEMPEECKLAGVEEKALKVVHDAEQLYSELPEDLKEYAFLHGHRMRWLLGMNDRALMHMLELRTTPQGHPNYRKVCQDIHALLLEKFPQRAVEMSFVNHNPVFWSRAESEARQREKEELLGD